MCVHRPAHDPGDVIVEGVALRSDERAVPGLQDDADVVVLLTAKHPVKEDDVSGAGSEAAAGFMVLQAGVAEGELLPSAAPREVARHALVRAVGDGEPRLDAAVVDKGRAPEPVRLPEVLLGEAADEGFEVGLPAGEVSVEGLQGRFPRGKSECLSCCVFHN